MRRIIAAIAVAVVFALAGSVQTASADSDSKCNGQIVAGIAATWPWAHNGQTDFAPAPGAIALWLKDFGPGLGISSVKELQAMFCSPT